MNVVYKITYPNGKIYVGSDQKDCLMTYFGSGVRENINGDPTLKNLKDFKIRKQIIWQSKNATKQELKQKEDEFIVKLGANNPKKGYNLRPKLGGAACLTPESSGVLCEQGTPYMWSGSNAVKEAQR